MLRITAERDPDGIHFKLDGKVAGPWVDELERSWYAATEAAEGGRVLVDLSEVTFVDAEGKKLLSWMFRRGAEFRCTGCMTRGIVEEIKREQPVTSEDRLGSRGAR